MIWLLLALTLLPSAWLAWTSRDMPQFGRLNDDSTYFVTAKSLAFGGGHRIESLPGQPHQTKYPPLYPLLLSLVWRANPSFPENLALAALLAWLMMPLYMLLVWRLFREHGFERWQALPMTALLMLSPITVSYSLLLMSELPFTILLLLIVMLAERAGTVSSRQAVPLSAAVGLVAGAAYLMRSAALPLLLTAPLVFAVRRQFLRGATFAAAMLPAVVGWQIWTNTHALAGTDLVTLYHTKYLGFHLANVSWDSLGVFVIDNLNAMMAAIGKFFLFHDESPMWYVTVTRVLAVASVAGAVRLARRTGKLHYPAYALAYGAILLQWHYPAIPRFLIPVAPLLVAGLVTELRSLTERIRATWRKPKPAERGLAVGMAVLLLLLGLGAVRQTWYGITSWIPAYLDFARQSLDKHRRIYSWIRESVPEQGQFYADRDALLYLYTGRRACSLRIPPVLIYRRDSDGVRRFLATLPDRAKQFELSYALVTDEDFSLETASLDNGKFQVPVEDGTGRYLLHRDGAVAVYRIPDPRAAD